MTKQDERELDWWRSEFATCFMSDNLPKPGTALYGMRLEIREQDSGLLINKRGRLIR